MEKAKDYSTESGRDRDTDKKETRVEEETLARWEKIQTELRSKIITENTETWQNDFQQLTKVAGLDISYPADAHDKDACDAFAAVVICEYPSMKIIHQKIERVRLDVPYIPGFLAFRESSLLIRVLKSIIEKDPSLKPDVLLVDGNGLLHPQRCGAACHIGYNLSIPAVGVAKNLHHLEGIDCTKKTLQNMPFPGDFILIRDNNNDVIGMALKTAKNAKNPIYVSIGHNISLETAQKLVTSCSKFRIPEPLRFADMLSREAIRKLEEEA